jgi:hypothetical protein
VVQEAIGDESIQDAHRKKWVESAERGFTQVRDRRLAEASQQVEALINNMNMRLNALMADSSTDSATMSAALNTFFAEYSVKAGGPTKWQRLAEFLQCSLQVRFLCATCHALVFGLLAIPDQPPCQRRQQFC